MDRRAAGLLTVEAAVKAEADSSGLDENGQPHRVAHNVRDHVERQIEIVDEVDGIEQGVAEVLARGFKRGLQPQEIVGVTEALGETTFLMKWVGSDEKDLVSASEALMRCPHIVQNFCQLFVNWPFAQGNAANRANNDG